jgi:hypothetical protein
MGISLRVEGIEERALARGPRARAGVCELGERGAHALKLDELGVDRGELLMGEVTHV